MGLLPLSLVTRGKQNRRGGSPFRYFVGETVREVHAVAGLTSLSEDSRRWSIRDSLRQQGICFPDC